MSGLPARGIFISYRRAEAAPYARLLQRELKQRIPGARVFMDMDSIAAGVDFAEAIRNAVEFCAVLVALIGPQWATITDEKGRRRLDDPRDFVRLEVKTALERAVRVIPVLIDGAKPPQQQQLPPELHRLARLNALELSNGRYQYQEVDRLLDLIQQVLAAAPRGSPVRALRLLADAEGVARSVRWAEGEVRALSDVAKALSARDPDRAAQIFAEVERTAQSIDNQDDQAGALLAVASALAGIDPARAERLVQSVRGEARPEALSIVARAMAATDPHRAERTAQSITSGNYMVLALAEVAQALAATDPDRAARLFADAERAAQSRPYDLAVVGSALAATDPVRAARLFADAERIAQSNTDQRWRAADLADVARALAAADPARAARLFADAERIAQSITQKDSKASALSEVVSALAATDPDRAERLAKSIPRGGGWREHALAAVAEALAATDPDRAERIVRSIADTWGTFSAIWKATVLSEVARTLAATDPDRAERLANSIPDQRWRAKALVAIAEA